MLKFDGCNTDEAGYDYGTNINIKSGQMLNEMLNEMLRVHEITYRQRSFVLFSKDVAKSYMGQHMPNAHRGFSYNNLVELINFDGCNTDEAGFDYGKKYENDHEII